MKAPLVSIITAVYNSENYIKNAIQSVFDQSYTNWELIIVNDGSLDNSEKIVLSFSDNRIRYFKQDNKGVSAARNVGLSNMNGDYFCFLDADDVLPNNSLESRLLIFQHDRSISFVDGKVQYVDKNLQLLPKTYLPTFRGAPFQKLLQLDASCLFGNTWMIKRDSSVCYEFDEHMNHSEDLFFYLTISNKKLYNFTEDVILLYRQRNDSAMRDLQGLEDGYILLIKNIRHRLGIVGWPVIHLKMKILKIMVLSYIFDDRKLLLAIKSPFKVLRA